MQEENSLKSSIQTQNAIKVNKPFAANLYYLFVRFCKSVSLWVIMGLHLVFILIVALIPSFIKVFETGIFSATFISFIAVNLFFLMLYSLIFGYNIFLKSKSDESELIILSKPITRNQIIFSRIVFALVIAFIYSFIVLIISLLAFGINSKIDYYNYYNDIVINPSVLSFNSFLTIAYYFDSAVLVLGTWFGSFFAFLFFVGFISIIGLCMSSSKGAMAISLSTLCVSMLGTILIDYTPMAEMFTQGNDYYDVEKKSKELNTELLLNLSSNRNFELPFTYYDYSSYPSTQNGTYYFNWNKITTDLINHINQENNFVYNLNLPISINDRYGPEPGSNNLMYNITFKTIYLQQNDNNRCNFLYSYILDDISRNYPFISSNDIQIDVNTFNSLIDQNFTIYQNQSWPNVYNEYINNVFSKSEIIYNTLESLTSNINSLNGLTTLDYILPTNSLSFGLGFGQNPLLYSSYYTPHNFKTNILIENNKINSYTDFVECSSVFNGYENLSPFWAHFIIQIALNVGLYTLIWFVYYRRDYH